MDPIGQSHVEYQGVREGTRECEWQTTFMCGAAQALRLKRSEVRHGRALNSLQTRVESHTHPGLRGGNDSALEKEKKTTTRADTRTHSMPIILR